MRANLVRAVVVVLTVGLLVAVCAAGAAAKDPSYEGTYVGVATADSGRQVPITVMLRDEGDVAAMSLSSMGYTVRLYAPEQWNGTKAMTVSPSVPAIYASILDGSGSATFSNEGAKWTGAGSGAGTALGSRPGSADGSAEMISSAIDPQAAEAWHVANPVASAVAVSSSPKLFLAADAAAQPLAPHQQLPLPIAERVTSALAIGVFTLGLALLGMMGAMKMAPAAALAASSGGPNAAPPTGDASGGGSR
jgi:hypothetical protein